MTRLHLFEFEDQPWCPAVLRNAVTSYLRVAVALTRQVGPVVPALADLLRTTGETSILDLCSGSGGIARRLGSGLNRLGLNPRIVLSDLYPDTTAFRKLTGDKEGGIEFLPSPLDARAVPAELPGLRTMFNAFHHFRPQDAQQVLRSAATSGRPIAIAEFIERGLFPLSGVLFSPLLVLFVAPFLRPFRWPVLLFTYVIPLVPLIIFWDALVSWLRVYSVEDLRQMAEAAAAPDYVWEAGHWGRGPTRVTYLVGRPR